MTVVPIRPASVAAAPDPEVGPVADLSDDEQALARRLHGRLRSYQARNAVREGYYEGRERVRQLGIAIPPQLEDLETVVGWPALAVDLLAERMHPHGLWSPTDLGLDELLPADALSAAYAQANVDRLLHGTAFLAVQAGGPGDGDAVVTAESPRRMTGEYDLRSRRLTSALRVVYSDRPGLGVAGTPEAASLMLPNETVHLTRDGSRWAVVDREEHRLGRVPVVQLVNRPRAGHQGGRPQLTRAVLSLTDSAVRTMLRMEITAELFSAPQRWLLGADESMLVDKDGNAVPKWLAYLGQINLIPNDDEGERPQIQQMPAQSPQPHVDQLRALVQMLSGETGIPPQYLGLFTDNPASADAIRENQARLVSRAEQGMGLDAPQLADLALTAVMVRDRLTDPPAGQVEVIWRDAATPTRAAMADETQKLIASGVLRPDSEVTWRRLGMSPAEIAQLRAERTSTTGAQTRSAVAVAADAARRDPRVAELSTRRGDAGAG